MPEQSKSHSATIILLAATLLAGALHGAQAAEFRYGKEVRPNKLVHNGRPISKDRFEIGISKQVLKLQRSGATRDSGFDFTAINVVEDCSASITCGDGTKIECSIQGPGTCESGMVSVACITATTSEHSSCPVN